jgi:hypothetical protein
MQFLLFKHFTFIFTLHLYKTRKNDIIFFKQNLFFEVKLLDCYKFYLIISFE